MKKIGMMMAGFCLALSSLADMSETKRGTFDGIEWLYSVDYQIGRVVFEKAILLTSESYNMRLNINEMLVDIFHANGYGVDYRNFKECDVLIGSSAFEGNSYLSKIEIMVSPLQDAPKINLSIGERAFKGCCNFNTFIIDGEKEKVFIRDIGASAFEECATGEECWGFSLGVDGGEYDVFSNITNIGDRAFFRIGCPGYNLGGLTFPETLVSIGKEAFKECNLSAEFHLPSSLTEIKEGTFEKCSGVFSFKKGLREIGSNAFRDCVMMVDVYNSYYGDADVKLPEGLEKVEDSAFDGAVYNSLKIPKTIKYIGHSAFAGGMEYYTWAQPWPPYYYSSELEGSLVIPESVEYIGTAAFSNHPYLESVILEAPITKLPFGLFMRCFGLRDIKLPNSLETIEGSVFLDCTNLTVTIPSSVVKTEKGNSATIGNPKCIRFEGLPPDGILTSKLLDAKDVLVPIEYQSQWAPYFRPNMKFAKKVDGEWVALGGKVISNAMRPSDPTIMDIKYKVTSTKDKVNVRILAFEDGQRSFAKVLRPETFVDGTEANVGDGVAANVEHTISWQVSKDWDVDLAKVSIEVYVQEDNLLPLQLTTIPAIGERAAVTFSRNVPDRDKVMNALYWLYADKSADLTLANGALKCGNTQLVNGSTLSDANAVSYIYSKMGYGTLSGDTLKYVNELMRTNLNPSGLTQYAVKEGAAQ